MTPARLDAHGAEIVVLPNPRDVAGRSASLVISTLEAALRDRDVVHVALTGGSMPAGVFRILSAPRVRDRLDWARVHVWWGDDRFVRPDDPLCNFRVADMTLFMREDGDTGIRLPPDHIHPFPLGPAVEGGLGAEWCARRYTEELRSLTPVGDHGWPRFDLMLLGVGPDAHVLSVFPGSAAFDSGDLALAIPAPTHVEPHVPRVTLNPAVLQDADALLVMIAGPKKAEAVEMALTSAYEPRRWPAQLALRPGATWVLDAAAASRVRDDLERRAAEASDGDTAGAEAEQQRTGGTVDEWCTHLDQIRDVTPSADGCEDCLRIGGRWVHLRMCLICGHAGCCDNSPNKHATAHFKETGHPLIRSLEPGEDWAWCYVDEIDFVLE